MLSFRPFLMAKRRNPTLPPPSKVEPSTPPTSPIIRSKAKPIALSRSSKKLRSVLSFRESTNQSIPSKWISLNLDKTELSLPLTFPTGQTFRWRQTGSLQYTGVVGSHLVSLKQLENGDVSYCSHSSSSNHCDDNAVRLALLDFLNVGISLGELWEVFSASDSRFAELARHLSGARVLRQDPFECLIQFLCSSNNNIGRITKMVDYISSLGDYLGNVEGFEFRQFPSLERLAMVSEDELRDAGFGYRAKYIVGTLRELESKPGGGAEWLLSLRETGLETAIGALSTLPGVGPKVAACIALFSLDQHHAIPVDTHVWQIATRHLLPELAGARLTPKLCTRVAEAFVRKYGKYAGWAQTLLFVADLPSQKPLLSPQFSTVKKTTTQAEALDETSMALNHLSTYPKQQHLCQSFSMENEEGKQPSHKTVQNHLEQVNSDFVIALTLQEQERDYTMLEMIESDEDESQNESSSDETDMEGYFQTIEEEMEEEEEEEDEIDPDELSYEELIALGEFIGEEKRGLSEQEISSILHPNNSKAVENNIGMCVICQVEEGEKLVRLPCQHPYHSDCISKWLQIKKTCPICGREVLSPTTQRS